ncbi:unnamed protein product [[Candida] boidinii]|nr:unnamed protein product [[Candida] boidinii]
MYYLVDEMRKRKKLNEEAYKSHIQSLQERKLQQQQQQTFSQPQSQPQHPQLHLDTAPSHIPANRVVSQPVPQNYQHNQSNQRTPTPPSLPFPQAAYKSPHSPSSDVAPQILENLRISSPHSNNRSNTIRDRVQEESSKQYPQQQQQQLPPAGSGSTGSPAINSLPKSEEIKSQGLGRSTSSSRRADVNSSNFANANAAANNSGNTGIGIISSSSKTNKPYQSDSSSNYQDANETNSDATTPSVKIVPASNIKDSENVVRRVGSMRITSKEKQQMSLPPLPPTSKQQIQQHQRAISAYTAAEFQQEQNNKPSRMTSMRNPDRQQQQQIH